MNQFATNHINYKWEFNKSAPIVVCTLFFLLNFQMFGLTQTTNLSEPQIKALEYLKKYDTISNNTVWPNIDSKNFLENLRENIIHPVYLYQGRNTNFCGYAAVSFTFIKWHPEQYAKCLMELFLSGTTIHNQINYQPSKPVLWNAGILKNKGKLEIKHADQIWFLTLADHYKSYVNILDRHYDLGNEEGPWAGTTLHKFNKMVRNLMGGNTKSVGADFFRPWVKDYYQYIKTQLASGIVYLYVNNKYLHQTRHTTVKLRAPSHFIVLKDIKMEDEEIIMTYWDYGHYTETSFTNKTLKAIIFGVIKLEN